VYIWQRKEWPKFRWDSEKLSPLLTRVSHAQGRMLGRMESLGLGPRQEAQVQTLTEDVVKSSEIEGEKLEREQVRSSVARQLGLDLGGLVPSDRDVDGIVELMLDATSNYEKKLTAKRLFKWHASLFATIEQTSARDLVVGKWRNDRSGPMQVVSGPVGKEKVHYEAPPAQRVDREMRKFLDWFDDPGDTDPLLAAGLAHLWFVTVHPFDDGNGRIARAVADMALARSEKSGQRFYSMPSQIRRERNAYYTMLERTQTGELDVTNWLDWFLMNLLNAIESARDTLGGVLAKARFWERFAQEPLNERQRLVLNRLQDRFEGKLTTSKYAKLAHCSQDTAHRDILDLVQRGALKKDPGGGRSTSYSLAE
jgi:Fic family protein